MRVQRIATAHSTAGDPVGMTIATRKTPNKLGALSLMGNAFILFLIWLVFFWAGSTNPLGGVNSVHGSLIRITVGVPAIIMIAANLVLARQLWRGGFAD